MHFIYDIQWNPALRSPCYYGHLVITATLFCPGETPIHFLIRKRPQCGQPVNAANGHIVKYQRISSYRNLPR